MSLSIILIGLGSCCVGRSNFEVPELRASFGIGEVGVLDVATHRDRLKRKQHTFELLKILFQRIDPPDSELRKASNDCGTLFGLWVETAGLSLLSEPMIDVCIVSA
eukprot:751476-Hanusia_phi.AAC.4